MTQPKKLTDAQLNRRILAEQRKLLARIATKRQRITALHAEIDDLHAQLREAPTMVLVRDAAYVAAPAQAVSTDGHDAAPMVPHVEHLRYGYAGVENLCNCAACLTDEEKAS